MMIIMIIFKSVGQVDNRSTALISNTFKQNDIQRRHGI